MSKKDKKGGDFDRAEIIDNPTGKYKELKKINKEMGSILDIQKNLVSKFEVIEKNLINEVSHDRELSRKDTVQYVTQTLDQIIAEFNCLQEMNPNLREKLYFLIENISITIYDYCHRLRKSNYSCHATKYLVWIILLIESNVVLSSARYLKWRVKVYSELAFCYEDYFSYKTAYKVIMQAVQKINELKSIEEQQNPVPEYLNSILLENFRVLKILEIKYGFLSGSYPLDAWKKKLDDTYSSEDKASKYICIINCISNLSKFNSIINHDGLKTNNKTQAIQYMFESVKTEINNIKTGILELIEKKKRDIEKEKKIKENFKNFQPILDQYNQMDDNMIKHSVWRNAIKNVPIELHVELYKACYDCKLWKEYLELLECLLIRIKYRRVEIPYIAEIDIQVSSIQFSNIPNKFEKIQIDLNVNHYKEELKKLREEGKYVGKVKEQPVVDKKDKKPDPKAQKGKEIVVNEVENPYEQIEGLQHQFVYVILKRSHNPQKAIINFRVVMGNEKMKSKLGDTERAIAIPIKIYNPAHIKEKLIPYLVYEKSNTGLIDQDERLKAITDFTPIVTNSQYAEPAINYKKCDFELTQAVTNQTSYNFNRDYIYFNYK